mmetsp:Transcript_108560/g.280700  ORF Transcript_108560/g.280700 Transcript_108560/m.280700 type:complete len:125 (+) Transcript_108560:722-1096(+)
MPRGSTKFFTACLKHLPSPIRSLQKNTCTLEASKAPLGSFASAATMEPPGTATEKAPFAAIDALAAATNSSHTASPIAASEASTRTFRPSDSVMLVIAPQNLAQGRAGHAKKPEFDPRLGREMA